jgi:hypothetical protein
MENTATKVSLKMYLLFWYKPILRTWSIFFLPPAGFSSAKYCRYFFDFSSSHRNLRSNRMKRLLAAQAATARNTQGARVAFWDARTDHRLLDSEHEDVTPLRNVGHYYQPTRRNILEDNFKSKYSGVCYNERCYNERMLQRTVFINKIRMLQRTRRNIIY